MTAPGPDASAKILVVEDDTSLGAGLVAVLAGTGYEVRWAQSASQAQLLLTRATADTTR